MTSFYNNMKMWILSMLALVALPAAAGGTLDITIGDITADDATISIVPSEDGTKFCWHMLPKATFEANGGEETAIENRINVWKASASYYDDTTWQEMMSYDQKEIVWNELLSDRFDPLTAGTAYVVYAFGMDSEGNVTIPLCTKEFTTLSQNAGALDISIENITFNDAEITVSPGEGINKFFWDVKLKSEFNENGGAGKAAENQIKIWEYQASWYDNTTWTDMMDLASVENATQELASDKTDLLAGNDYVVYAFAMDSEGNLTAPVCTKEFKTLPAILSDNTFNISVSGITPGSRPGRMTVTAKVVPSNNDTYTLRCVTKDEFEKVDLTPGSTSLNKFITGEILYYLPADEIVSGEHEFTFTTCLDGNDYYLVAMGLDENRQPSTVLTPLAFKCEEMEQPQPATLDITVENITFNDAEITVNPSEGINKFFWDVKLKSEFNENGGAEKAVENQIKIWEYQAGWYDNTKWTDMMDLASVESATQEPASDKIDLLAGNDYVVYAFAMDSEGNLTAPVCFKEFKTLPVELSDNTFALSIKSIKAGEYPGRMTVIAKAVPSNNEDNYIVKSIPKDVFEKVDLTPGSTSLNKFITSEMLFYLPADQIVSGEHEFTFTTCLEDNEYYLVAMGIDENRQPTTALTSMAFKCEKTADLSEIKLEVTEISPMNAHIKITPPDEDMLYYYDITRKKYVDQKGGFDAIPQELIIEWWKFLAEIYGGDSKWQDFIELQCRSGEIDDYVAELMAEGEISNVFWDDTYVLYAVGFNTEGEILTQTAYVEFTTPAPGKSDLTFEFEPVSIEKDEETTAAYGGTEFFIATIDIYPSNAEDGYRAGYCRTVILDQYDDKENGEYSFICDQWYNFSTDFTDAVRLVMPELRAYDHNKNLQDYYIVVMGWNEGPTTELNKYLFNYETTELRPVNASDAKVIGGAGEIRIKGEYESATVYSVSGSLTGTLHGADSLSVPAGVYIVSYKTNGGERTEKVIVK